MLYNVKGRRDYARFTPELSSRTVPYLSMMYVYTYTYTYTYTYPYTYTYT